MLSFSRKDLGSATGNTHRIPSKTSCSPGKGKKLGLNEEFIPTEVFVRGTNDKGDVFSKGTVVLIR
jgi:hypothetical protein